MSYSFQFGDALTEAIALALNDWQKGVGSRSPGTTSTSGNLRSSARSCDRRRAQTAQRVGCDERREDLRGTLCAHYLPTRGTSVLYGHRSDALEVRFELRHQSPLLAALALERYALRLRALVGFCETATETLISYSSLESFLT